MFSSPLLDSSVRECSNYIHSLKLGSVHGMSIVPYDSLDLILTTHYSLPSSPTQLSPHLSISLRAVLIPTDQHWGIVELFKRASAYESLQSILEVYGQMIIFLTVRHPRSYGRMWLPLEWKRNVVPTYVQFHDRLCALVSAPLPNNSESLSASSSKFYILYHSTPLPDIQCAISTCFPQTY